MPLLTRRQMLAGGGLMLAAGVSLASYPFIIEPGFRLLMTRYAPRLPAWPDDLPLRIAVIADIHAAEPFMSAARIGRIVARVNALKPDLVVLLGDFVCTHSYVTAYVRPEAWADALAALEAPLGVHAVLGNHDWWSAAWPLDRPDGSASVRRALERARIPVMENDALRLAHAGRAFWLMGLGDQIAVRLGHRHYQGADDLAGMLGRWTNRAEPALLLAHEPFIYPQVPQEVALTLAGHTHGGQVHVPGFVDRFVARIINTRFLYGHFAEQGRHMIVAAGLGTSNLPIRFARPPEIVEVLLGGAAPPDAAP